MFKEMESSKDTVVRTSNIMYTELTDYSLKCNCLPAYICFLFPTVEIIEKTRRKCHIYCVNTADL
jgi:hypothetical protein